MDPKIRGIYLREEEEDEEWASSPLKFKSKEECKVQKWATIGLCAESDRMDDF